MTGYRKSNLVLSALAQQKEIFCHTFGDLFCRDNGMSVEKFTLFKTNRRKGLGFPKGKKNIAN